MNIRRTCFIALAFLNGLLVSGCRTPSAASRPESWARPRRIAGLQNCYSLDDRVFRSAQPGLEGFLSLENAGFRSVLCLNKGYCDLLPSCPTLLRVHYFELNPMTVTEDDLVKALRILSRSIEVPALVHCTHGADRTGVVCAAYRIVCQGWTKEEAIAEMLHGGYGFHSVCRNHLVALLRNLHTEEIRARLRL